MLDRPRTPVSERLAALAVATLALASLRAQFDAMDPAAGSVAQRLWAMAGYFTILTNALVAAHMLLVALHWRISASRAAGLLLSIVMVGLVYHVLLARLWQPDGLLAWADLGLHTGVPLAYALWWIVLAPKALGWPDVKWWLIWPVGYAGYALTRGAMTGFWPYPFLNADTLGWSRVAAHVAILAAAFALGGLCIRWVAGRLQRQSSPG